MFLSALFLAPKYRNGGNVSDEKSIDGITESQSGGVKSFLCYENGSSFRTSQKMFTVVKVIKLLSIGMRRHGFLISLFSHRHQELERIDLNQFSW